jgi:hypothetical protein
MYLSQHEMTVLARVLGAWAEGVPTKITELARDGRNIGARAMGDDAAAIAAVLARMLLAAAASQQSAEEEEEGE